MSESFPLPTEAEAVIPSLLKRFNSGKIEAMMALYAPEAAFSRTTGEPSLIAPSSRPYSSTISSSACR